MSSTVWCEWSSTQSYESKMVFSCCETARRRTKRQSLAPAFWVRPKHMAFIWCDVVQTRRFRVPPQLVISLYKPEKLRNVEWGLLVSLWILRSRKKDSTAVALSTSPSRGKERKRTHRPGQLHITLLTLQALVPTIVHPTSPEQGSRERGTRQARQHPYHIYSKSRPAHPSSYKMHDIERPGRASHIPRKLAYSSQPTLSRSSRDQKADKRTYHNSDPPQWDQSQPSQLASNVVQNGTRAWRRAVVSVPE
ncbi:hypothetical protein BKA58DRAFT_44756 [Alternaria rosae]|uniref:uncharacterized protein n=1 Tax=Alternaria rosae TaxID=1187941 RepID=UPI001E8D9499|nr:uncharacterized protein BKA58DRAFT_44756 [Alternaria rosae]KAH6861027.1 hypothetical protein BKA58DRAFT_44756 [Alternaria rosae]